MKIKFEADAQDFETEISKYAGLSKKKEAKSQGDVGFPPFFFACPAI